jgi:predicted methyltransferase
MSRIITSAFIIGCAMGLAAPVLMAKPAKPAPALAAAVNAPTRTAANVARDKYRNPAQTLAFFGVKPTDKVVELWPSGGWYTEILAPYLKDKGTLTVAPPMRGTENVKKFLATNAVYSNVQVANFPVIIGGGTPVAPGSADVVLTFRNVHNFKMGSGHPENADYSEAAFKEIYAMLKPGGVLGIEDHRLGESADAERERKSGYVKVSTVRKLAEQAGFKFAGSSEINANPKDTKDYPKGVWTLPPRFAEGDTDRAKFAAIGESDRMTLKFVKPKK